MKAAASPPAKIQFNLSKRLLGAVKGKSCETFHRTPVGTERKDPRTAGSVLDDAADNFIPLYPLDPPDVSVNAVDIELNSRHDAVPGRSR